MRKAVVWIAVLLPLLGGCTKDDPLIPELAGRWAAPNASKLRAALIADRMQSEDIARQGNTDCRAQYVTFEKRGILLFMNRTVHPLFAVSAVKRDGARVILTGHAPMPAGGDKATIELILRNGEVRFDDIIDQRGRSIRYERFENEQARRVGINTLGDVFRLVLDVKPCRV